MSFSVDGHEPLKSSVPFRVSSSEKRVQPTAFDGQGTIFINLLPDAFVAERFLEITFTRQIVVSGLKFEMPDNMALSRFALLIEESGIQLPNVYTHWGVSDG